MGKAASHFIWCSGQTYRLHYLEWDHHGRLSGIYPLEEEIAGVAFYNGTLVPILSTDLPGNTMSEKDWQALASKVVPGSLIKLYHLEGEMIKKLIVNFF
ncbi:hypothetical protein [Parabacteroides sp. PF5-6]|uniref:hypothetical protein n=1 Tax=Parabacteroides sp. PF5-6 TaxID=1742403 RepID=UPI002406ADF3|nr:hypothetical protein [Parabacteroides sp. PF5-6]MDF9829067.1 hypothetical protein [Parabacteroides sp. PF5-6]